MAVYNTPSDAANTAVRALLSSVGELYYKSSFNTGSGKGKDVWVKIQAEFGNACAYCGKLERLQIEHLIMFNRYEYGLHHPGNIVPVCKSCNEWGKDLHKKYISWSEQLSVRCGGKDSSAYVQRKAMIDQHILKYEYPILSQQERHAIAVIAESLYENIKAESEKSLRMYSKLDEVFVRNVI